MHAYPTFMSVSERLLWLNIEIQVTVSASLSMGALHLTKRIISHKCDTHIKSNVGWFYHKEPDRPSYAQFGLSIDLFLHSHIRVYKLIIHKVHYDVVVHTVPWLIKYDLFLPKKFKVPQVLVNSLKKFRHRWCRDGLQLFMPFGDIG